MPREPETPKTHRLILLVSPETMEAVRLASAAQRRSYQQVLRPVVEKAVRKYLPEAA